MAHSWKPARQARELKRAKDRARSTFHLARDLSWHHARILEGMADARAIVAGAPREVRGNLSGYMEALHDAMWRDLAFAHVAPDGTKYTGDRTAPAEHFAQSDVIYAAGRGAEMATWPNGHFWKHSGKPFMPAEPEPAAPIAAPIAEPAKG